MKKILALLLVFCMLVPMAAFAETTEVSYAGSNATCNVYIEGEATTTYVSVILKDRNGNVGYINQVTPDSENNGKYALKFKFTGDISDYSVYVRDEVTGQDISPSVKEAVATNVLYTASLDVAVDNADRAYIQQGDALNISVDIENKYGNDENVTVLVAAYGENNKLLAVESTTIAALYDDLCATKNVDVSEFEIPQGTVKAKVFAWSDVKTMIPVAPSKALVNKKITIHLVGDSLCETYTDSRYPRQGWGAFIKDYVAVGVEVNNTGTAGRSTFSFLYGEPGYLNDKGVFTIDNSMGEKGYPYYDYENCRWNKTFIEKAKPGDYVIIGLGINDFYQTGSDIWECEGEKYLKRTGGYAKISYNADGSVASVSEDLVQLTNPTKIYSWTSLSEGETKPEGTYMTSYKENLRTMLDTALEIGVTPILTSTTGHYTETNYGDTFKETPKEIVGLFEEMKEVAEEYKDQGVVYLPLFEYTDKVFHEWGNKVRFDTVHLRKGSFDWFKKYGNKPITYYGDADADGVHYNENGAKWVASHIMRLVYESDSTLKNYINEPDIFDIPMIVIK